MKYKLIKTFPGSAPLGTIVDTNNVFLGIIYNYTNYPEFWEKVVEKDYEILEFTSKYSGCIAIKNQKGTYDSDNFFNMDEFRLLSDNRSIITKVKRLSDGEIFSIGDYVKVKLTKTQDTIKEFNVLSNHLCVSLNPGFDISYYNKKGCNITVIEKIKPPLFTTEEGVDIAEGNRYYSVLENYQIIPNICNKHGISLNRKEVKYFFYKEEAEHYIIMNKPCISIKELDLLSIKSWNITELKKLVKSKL
jgi:hypothetical protein